MKKNKQQQNRYGCEARPASPLPERTSSGQTEPGITQNEGIDYAAYEQREEACGRCGDYAHNPDHYSNEQHGQNVACHCDCL